MLRLSSLAALPCALTLLTGCPPTEPPPTETPPAEELPFPADFWWGASTAQWVGEGDEGATGPIDSNWRRWTLMDRTLAAQQNPDGNGFRTLYADDARRAGELGMTRLRVSIDWSRVEPTPGVYDEAELDHLVDVLDALRAEGVEPVLTLWHWVVPPWVQNPDSSAAEGDVDLLASRAPADQDLLFTRWEAFVRQVVARVKDRVDVYTVLNDPVTFGSAAYISGDRPPGRLLNIPSVTQFGINLANMQAIAYDVLHEVDDTDADGDGEPAFVGLTMTATRFDPWPADDVDLQFAAETQDYVFNEWFLRAVIDGDLDVDLDGSFDNASTDPAEGHYAELAGRVDFIGLQFYGPVKVTSDVILRDFHPLYGRPRYNVADYDATLPHSGTGQEINAAAFRTTLQQYQQWGLPIVITQMGTTTNLPATTGGNTATPGPLAPEQSALYMMEHLWELAKLLEEGADIRGFFLPALTDGFEWEDGLKQRFGAYSVDFAAADKTRTLTELGEAYRDVATANKLDETLWDKWLLDSYPTDTRQTPSLTTTEAVVWGD